MPPPSVEILLTPPPAEEDDLPSYLPPRVSSFNKPPPLSHTPEKSANSDVEKAPSVGTGEDILAHNAVVAQTAIRGYLARKEYKELYELNRWRLDAPKVTTARLVSPAKDKAKRKSRPASRGFRVESQQQHIADPDPSDTPDEPIEGVAQEGDDKPPRAPSRKTFAPGMLAPGMGMDFNPALVKLKSAPRPVSMDLKLAAQSPPLNHHMLKHVPAAPTADTLKPVPTPLTADNPHTKSMPDMPKLKSAGKSPLGESRYYHNPTTQETQWQPPQMVPEHTIVKKIQQSSPQQHSQTNLFGNLEMLIPAHKFVPPVPKKPPPPPTIGTPPPAEHSPLRAAPLSPDNPHFMLALTLDPVVPPASSSSSSSSSSNPPPPPSSTQPTTTTTTTTTTTSTQPAASGNSTQATSSNTPAQAQAQAPSQPNMERTPSQPQPNMERTPSQQTTDKRSALRKLLDAFLGRRPSKDELVKKNILHEEDSKKDAKEKKRLEKERKKKEKEEKKREKAKK